MAQNITFKLPDIARKLEQYPAVTQPVEGLTKAAVAMILREIDDQTEILFIERAADDRDPWSGHLAFPGGKVEADEAIQQTAERETYEEIGLSLADATYLGQLSDIVGANLPVQVSCFVFCFTALHAEPTVNSEVNDLFWVRLSDICNRERHLNATVGFDGVSFEVPAIRLPQHGKPVLWGITYRLVMQLLEIIDCGNASGLHYSKDAVH